MPSLRPSTFGSVEATGSCKSRTASRRRFAASSRGDRVVFYSPTDAFRGKDKLQSFTAIGVVKDGAPYQVDMGDGFSPFRRDVTWQTAAETPIRTLLDQLEFTKGNENWGYQLRSGLAEISELDMLRIARAMGASLT